MNKHIDRLKRGAISLAELAFVAFAGGLTIASFVAGFTIGMDAFGRPFILGLAFFLVSMAVVAYALGIVDQRETTKRKD